MSMDTEQLRRHKTMSQFLSQDDLYVSLNEDREGQDPVAWAVKNGWVIEAVKYSEKSARAAAEKLQKSHDLSGSLAAYRVEPLFARPVPAESVNARLVEALIQCRDRFLFYVEHHLANGAAVKAAENDRFVTLANQAIAAARAESSLSAPQSDALEQVRAEEREACAKACDELFPPPDEQMAVEWAAGTIACANAIRARGQK